MDYHFIVHWNSDCFCSARFFTCNGYHQSSDVYFLGIGYHVPVLGLAVVGVDGRAQSGFGGAAIAETLQDALDVAHTVGVIDVGNGGQRFRIGQISFSAGEAQEAALEHVQRYIALGLEQSG